MFPSPRQALLLLPLLLLACDKPPEQKARIRPVRTIVIQHSAAGESVTLTGQVAAQNTVNLAFRLNGRLIQRNADIGDAVTAGQVVARLEPQDAQNALRTAQANLSAAQGRLVQAQPAFQRQSELLRDGFTTRAQYDEAQQQLKSAQAQVDSAKAQLTAAQDNLGYTDLRSDVAGSVTAKGAEPGEVVSAGQMVLQVAQTGGRDAVFNVPAQLIRQAPSGIPVTIALSDDPSISVQGRVREVAPQADATTGTYTVKVELIDPPPTMRLGSTVTGSVVLNSRSVIQVPASALMQMDGKPTVWVVDPAAKTVAMQSVSVLRYDPTQLIISDGLKDGDLVVTAGVQALHPGQEVRVLGSSADSQP
jgi:RND family efflux transporter MFP subunit